MPILSAEDGSWEYDPKIVHLPGTKLTPTTVLHRTLDKVAKLKSVVVLMQWDDDTYAVDWSTTRVADLCTMSMMMDEHARRVLYQQDIPVESTPDPAV